MRRLALVTAAALAATVLGPLSPARADTPAPYVPDGTFDLPFPSTPFQVLAGGQHVFITAGGSYGVVVRDLDGEPVTVIEGEPGSSGMALSADGKTLYVALYNGDAISAIDTTSLQEVKRYSTGTASCPSRLTRVGGRIWFIDGCQGYPVTTKLGVLDLASSTVKLDTGPAGLHPTQLTSSPAAGNKLVVAFGDPTGPSQLDVLDATTTSPSVSASVASFGTDLAITPDGSQVYGGTDNYGVITERSLTDLSVTTTLPGGGTGAVAVSSTGLVAADDGPSVDVLSAGSRVRTVPDTVGPGSLAFDPSGTRLYHFANTAPTALAVTHDPGKHASTLSVVPAAARKVQAPISFSGRLASDVPLPASATLQVSRSLGSTTDQLPDVTTGPDGSFAFTDTVGLRGLWTYQVSWAGDDTHAGAITTSTFTVKGLAPALSLVTRTGPYAYGAKVTAVVKAAGAHGGTMTLTTTTYACCAHPSMVTKGVLDSADEARQAVTMTGNEAVVAAYGGDDVYEPGTLTTTLLGLSKVRATLSGGYTHSGSYQVFHLTTEPRVDVQVNPTSTSRSVVVFGVQEFNGEVWRTVSVSQHIALDRYGRAHLYYHRFQAGVSYRMQVESLASSEAADSLSNFVYLRFTR